MNNLRLVIIVAIFIVLIIVLFLNRILGSRRVKRKDTQAVKPSDDSSREERDASDVVGDFFGKEESAEKEKSKVDESTAEPEVGIEDQVAEDSNRGEEDTSSALGDFFDIEESEEKEIGKGGESAVEPEVVIEDQPSVDYEKIEADLKAVRDEVTVKIETDLKAVEGEVTAKIEADLKSVGDEVTTKIEGLILKVEAVEKEVLNKIENIVDVKIQEALNKINDRISEVVSTQIDSIKPVIEEGEDSFRKEEAPEEIKEKELADTIIPSGEIEKKNERDLSVLLKDRDILEKFRLFVRYQLDAFEIIPFDEAKAVAEEKKEKGLEMSSEVKKDVKVDKKESIDATTSTGKIEEKKSTGAVGGSVGPAKVFFQKFLSAGKPSTEEPKESVGEKVKFKEKKTAGAVGESVGPAKVFFQKFMSAGKPSTEVPKGLVEEKVESEEKKEGGLETSVEDRDVLEKLAGSLQMGEDSFDVLPSEESKTVSEEKKERDLEVSSEVKEDVKVEEGPIEATTSTEEVEEKISAGKSDDFDIEKFLEEEPAGMSSTEEFKELVEEVEIEETKKRDLEVQPEVKEDVKVDEKEPIEPITSTGEVEEKPSEGDVGGSVDFDIDQFLEEASVGLSSTEKPKESVEEKVELEEKKERDLEAPSEAKEDAKVDEKEPVESITSTGEVEEKISAGESDDFDIEKFLEKDPVGISPTEESEEVAEEKFELKLEEEKEEDLELPAEEAAVHEEIDEKEIDTIAPPPGDIEEKALEADKGEGAEEKKQSTVETSDFDIQEFLEELGTPPSEKDLESEKE